MTQSGILARKQQHACNTQKASDHSDYHQPNVHRKRLCHNMKKAVWLWPRLVTGHCGSEERIWSWREMWQGHSHPGAASIQRLYFLKKPECNKRNWLGRSLKQKTTVYFLDIWYLSFCDWHSLYVTISSCIYLSALGETFTYKWEILLRGFPCPWELIPQQVKSFSLQTLGLDMRLTLMWLFWSS